MIAYIALGCFAFIVATVYMAFYDFYKWQRNEAFANVPHSLFIPKIAPGGNEEATRMSPGPAMSGERLLADGTVPPMSRSESLENWGKTTSQQCYGSDIGESLKKTRNFLQRTNNYPRTHPDSCSAPMHEFVGTFYTPSNGVGNMPSSGTNYPPSTQCKGGFAPF